MKYNFDHDTSWDYFLKLLKSDLSVNERWIKLIEFHEKSAPKTYWTKLKSMDLSAEKELLNGWLGELVTKSPLPASVTALWIGIFKHMQDEKEMYVIYLSGADTYTKGDIDWAADLTYLPKDRYAVPGTLNEIDRLIEKDKTDYHFLDWILPIAYSAFIFEEIIRTMSDKKLFLHHKPELLFATGHDNGDYVDLSAIR